MYFDDHSLPHFHAIYNEYKAVISIYDYSLLYGDLPAKALGIVIEWAKLHQQELLQEWNLAQSSAKIRVLLYSEEREANSEKNQAWSQGELEDTDLHQVYINLSALYGKRWQPAGQQLMRSNRARKLDEVAILRPGYTTIRHLRFSSSWRAIQFIHICTCTCDYLYGLL